MKHELIRKLAITLELVGGAKISDEAKDVLTSDLDEYPPEAVSLALDRCRREVRGHLAPSDIIQRIDDGRPGAEEAWGMLPKSEAETVVRTDEMTCASHDLDMSDPIAARMTFKETYTRLTKEARERREPVKWTVSLGHDLARRTEALRYALALGRVSENQVKAILSTTEYEQLLSNAPPLPELPERTAPIEDTISDPEAIKSMLQGFRKSHGLPEDWNGDA